MWQRRKLLVLLLILLLFSACVIFALIPQWFAAAKGSALLPVNLHSRDEADYSADPRSHRIPAISLAILRDVILDNEPYATDWADRLATVYALLESPIPTMTLAFTQNPGAVSTQVPATQAGIQTTETPATQAPTASMTATATATATATPSPTAIMLVNATPQPTSQKQPVRTATSTPADTASYTSTPTNTPTSTPPESVTSTPANTATYTPTPTDTATPTPTEAATPTPTYTPTPTDTATPTPIDTATYTPTPTDTATSTPIDTATYTPTPTDTATSTPIDTATYTPTPTDTATPTPTLRPGCSDPLPVDGTLPDGFLLAVDPDDGATNVSINTSFVTLYFNQPMKNDGGGGSVERPEHYHILNTVDNKELSVVSRTYNPSNYALTLSFSTSDKYWQYATLYNIIIDGSLQNACGTKSSNQVYIDFTTEDAPAALNTGLNAQGSTRTATSKPSHSPTTTAWPTQTVIGRPTIVVKETVTPRVRPTFENQPTSTPRSAQPQPTATSPQATQKIEPLVTSWRITGTAMPLPTNHSHGPITTPGPIGELPRRQSSSDFGPVFILAAAFFALVGFINRDWLAD